MNIASRHFLHIEAISRQKEARRRDYAVLLFRKSELIKHIKILYVKVLLLTGNQKGSYNTNGYGNSAGYWWSTGSLVPYDGIVLNHPGQDKYLTLDVRGRQLKDNPHYPLHFVCETG